MGLLILYEALSMCRVHSHPRSIIEQNDVGLGNSQRSHFEHLHVGVSPHGNIHHSQKRWTAAACRPIPRTLAPHVRLGTSIEPSYAAAASAHLDEDPVLHPQDAS